MQAIVDLNGKQYQIEEGRYITVDRLPHNVDETIEIGNVLMVVDGEETLVGLPYVEGATVKAKVLRHARGPKILVYKMRRKKGYRRKNGHRQDYTQLQIEVLDFPGKKEKPKAAVTEAPVKEKAASKKTDKAADKPADKKKGKAGDTEKASSKPKSEPKTKAAKAKADEVKAESTEAAAPEAAPAENSEA